MQQGHSTGHTGASPSPNSPQAPAAPSPFPALPILIPLSSTALNSPLETHIPRHANLLNSANLSTLSYASLSIYISYVQWVSLQFLEKISSPESPDSSLGLQQAHVGRVEIPEGPASWRSTSREQLLLKPT